MGKIKKFIRRPLGIAAIIVVAFIVLVVAVSLGKNKKSVYEFYTIKKGEVVQEVSVTGRVKSADNVDLAFEKGGKVAFVPVKIGEKVKVGQLLAVLNNADISAQLSQALASVESARASLNQYNAALDAQEAELEELKIGASPEELQVVETKVENAKKSLVDAEAKADIDLNNSYDGVKDVLNDAYVKADDAVNKQIDELFTDDSTDNPQLTFFTGSQAETDAESKRVIAGTSLKKFKQELDILEIDKVSLDFELVNAENYLKTIQGFLDALNRAINESINLTQATLTNYKYYVNTGRTNVNTALTSVNAKKQAIAAQKALNQVNINTAKNTLASAQDDLNLKKSSATIQQIAIQEAAVNQAKANVESQVAQIKYAEANVDNYKAQVAKTIIVSPIDGIVTKQDCKVGEIVSANTSVVSVISEAQFEIEANTPEADIAKVRIGDTARVTLDTYGSDVFFEAKVIKIDPAETILDGVATYKTTLQFVKEDERIMSGMTANVDVQTAKKENVIFVPQRSVLQKNGGYVVLVEGDDNKTEEKKVEIGLRGSDGNMEIISGLNENEKIIISGVAK